MLCTTCEEYHSFTLAGIACSEGGHLIHDLDTRSCFIASSSPLTFCLLSFWLVRAVICWCVLEIGMAWRVWTSSV